MQFVGVITWPCSDMKWVFGMSRVFIMGILHDLTLLYLEIDSITNLRVYSWSFAVTKISLYFNFHYHHNNYVHIQ
jgi:hypothetical protein